MRGSLSAH